MRYRGCEGKKYRDGSPGLRNYLLSLLNLCGRMFIHAPRFMKNDREMEVINFADTPSIVNRYMMELRDVRVQNDPLRFRTNQRDGNRDSARTLCMPGTGRQGSACHDSACWSSVPSWFSELFRPCGECLCERIQTL